MCHNLWLNTWVTTLGQEFAQVTNVELYNIQGGWAPNSIQTHGSQNDHLQTLEIYWKMHHVSGPMLAERDIKIKELQETQEEINK